MFTNLLIYCCSPIYGHYSCFANKVRHYIFLLSTKKENDEEEKEEDEERKKVEHLFI